VDEVTVDGNVRPGPPGAGNTVIQDVGPDGRRLILRSDNFNRVWVKGTSDVAPKDLSWLDVTFMPILSGDGSLLVFGDGSSASGDNYAIMLRRTDGSPAVRLGEGADYSMSRDKQWVISGLPSVPPKLMMNPTGAGTPRRLDNGEFSGIIGATFLGDGSRIVACGSEPKHAVRCYVKRVAGGPFKPITPEGVGNAVASPDGEHFVAATGEGYRQFAVADGTSQPVPGIKRADEVLRYSPDGKFLWTWHPKVQPVRVEQIDLATGSRSLLLPPFAPRRAGVTGVGYVALADDPHTYAYIEREAAGYLFQLKRIK
jgi:hypothetical protein